MTREEIENIVRDTVVEVTGIKNFENMENLLDRELGIIPADFLYIFDMLERRFNIPVFRIFTYSTFHVMTVENIAKEVEKLLNDAPGITKLEKV